MHPYLNIAIKAARLAGKITVESMLHSECNSDQSIELEEAIIRTIVKAYPEHNINAKHSGEQLNNSEFTWVIDPLDGELNFVHEFPFFAVSIAILNGTQIEHGVIYNPVSDELFTASRGSGAKLNNRKIRCSPNNKLPEAFLAHNRLKSLQNIGFNRYMGSTALHLAFVAAGRIDGYCESNLQPYSIAAGALLVRESGGYVTDFNGKTDFFTTGDIVAANYKIQQQLLEVVIS